MALTMAESYKPIIATLEGLLVQNQLRPQLDMAEFETPEGYLAYVVYKAVPVSGQELQELPNGRLLIIQSLKGQAQQAQISTHAASELERKIRGYNGIYPVEGIVELLAEVPKVAGTSAAGKLSMSLTVDYESGRGQTFGMSLQPDGQFTCASPLMDMKSYRQAFGFLLQLATSQPNTEKKSHRYA